MKKRIVLIVCSMFLTLAGCGTESENEIGFQKEPIPDTVTVQESPTEENVTVGQSDEKESEAAETSDNGADPKALREDGERFEDVIILEGMEETVQYEHAINDGIGIEIDYDYESFDRHSESGKESFISIYDDAGKPENYLELTYRPETVEAVTASISEELSKEYELSTDTYELDNAGNCTRIDASACVGGQTMPDQLQKVYIVPAGDGTVLAIAHYSIESAEGFGRRFSYMMDTLVVKDRK